MSGKFIEIDRSEPITLPDNLEDWLNDNDLAIFIVDIVENLDTSTIENAYRGGGSSAYPPKMMLALLFYCYAKGIFSSRKMEKATYELIPVLYIVNGLHPDHDSINTFRKRFLPELKDLFVMLLQIAHKMGIFKLGDIYIDGTKIKANASKHKAMSWKYACALEEQLKEEVATLIKRAESENAKPNKEIDIPEEITRREARLEKIAEVKIEIELRAKERYEQEKAEYDAKMAEREAKEAARGRKFGGKKPKEPEEGARDKDQVNFTDEDSRIMPTSSGFEQSYNAQAGVDTDTHLIVEQHLTQQPNDKQEVAPTLERLQQLPEELGEAEKLLADTGYFSEANVNACESNGIVPYIPEARQGHNEPLHERFADDPPAPEQPNAVEAMRHRLKTREGKAVYARRKSTVDTAHRSRPGQAIGERGAPLAHT